ncbi:malate dehydrogenase, cytoplasmic [Cyanidioschyzon merolae strain 10D]|jgi:malate dehydrogenase|uniref:malate dehydrogenase n=1 Tax=Cyanidioschyzon merolae (strain NIES-3377 / 10D) TaxID=280699 RepID=M1VIR0_CYAM1|nr:malate dehydrogenase, cytoplasmic [Cyanidioschyzon merolae strain 10D]BAM83512.1 malate dehydrogenase, cytoplasmic [Cyanidioschyzon merolae strain 10D]|eukprot:XP_005539548.1 malate dehydrogenase, cytoplasmic [Cyanidioschyzon merolae strain 10D]
MESLARLTPLYPDRALIVAVTGAAGQIAYSLLPLLASGTVFGPQQRIKLQLLDVPAAESVLKGVCCELEDGAYPLLDHPVLYTSVADEAFAGADIVVLLGSFPRKPGMERKDLLAKNGTIFRDQGQALNRVAKADAHVIVVGNPANTNAWTLSQFCTKIPKEHITALARLDHNRLKSLVARKLDSAVSDVHNVIIWGNHSATQYPDVTYAYTPQIVQGKMRAALGGDSQLASEVIPLIQKRGAEVLALRKLSSAMSAAKAIGDHLRDWMFGTQTENEIVSMIVPSDGSYGIDKGLMFAFPVQCHRGGKYRIVSDLRIDDFSRKYIETTLAELRSEREEAMRLVSKMC